MKTKTSKGIHFTYTELLVITLAVLTALLAAFMVGRHIGIDQTIKSASYYSDGEDISTHTLRKEGDAPV